MRNARKIELWVAAAVSVCAINVWLLVAGRSQPRELISHASTMAMVFSEARPETLAAGVPELPRAYLDTTYAQPTGRTIAVPAGGDLQAAINAAKFGDVITLQAGATYVGNFTLPNKTSPGQGSGPGSLWVTIRSSAPDSSLPPPGTRISPSYAPAMPKIISPNSDPALSTATSAHHYRLIGLELGVQLSVGIYAILNFDTDARSVAEMAHDLIVDRCYIHGNNTDSSRRAIAMNCGPAAVIDSYLSNIHEHEADTQAIVCWSGTGPFKIVNNYLEAAGENILFGGADSVINGMVPSDIEFRNNTCSKPLSWKIGNAAFAGNVWAIKNLFELKNAQRLLIDRNTFEYTWAQAQDGTGILFTPLNQDGNSPWSTVQDVTFTNNVVRHVGNGINISGADSLAGGGSGSSLPSNRVLISNNLFDDVNGQAWGTDTEPTDGHFVLVVGGALNITIDHNTIFHSGNMISSDGVNFPNPGFTFTNNIIAHNSYGVWGSDVGLGNDALNHYFPNAVFKKNVVIGGEAKDYPSGNYFIASFDDVKFVNRAGGDYRLSAASPYRNAGTDGKNIGCDIDALYSTPTAVSLLAANYSDKALAAEAIAVAFGTDLAEATTIASAQPLPTALNGTTVTVRDGAGTERLAPLFFVSPTQINYLIPSGTAAGKATVVIKNAKGATALGAVTIARVATGLFTADATGKGLPIGQVLRVRNNTQSGEQFVRFDSTQNKWVAVPIDLSQATDQVYLILYGTGFRYRSALGGVTATIGGTNSPVSFAGAQGSYAGLDQVNILLPRSLAGRGDADLVLTVDGQAANTVRVNIK